MTKQERISAIAEMIINGKTKNEIISFANEQKWDVSEKTINGYITEANKLNANQEVNLDDDQEPANESVVSNVEVTDIEVNLDDDQDVNNEVLDNLFIEAENRKIEVSSLKEKAKDEADFIELLQKEIKEFDEKEELKLSQENEKAKAAELIIQAENEYREKDEKNIKSIHNVLNTLIEKLEIAIEHRRISGRSITRLVSVKKEAVNNLNKYVK